MLTHLSSLKSYLTEASSLPIFAGKESKQSANLDYQLQPLSEVVAPEFHELLSQIEQMNRPCSLLIVLQEVQATISNDSVEDVTSVVKNRDDNEFNEQTAKHIAIKPKRFPSRYYWRVCWGGGEISVGGQRQLLETEGVQSIGRIGEKFVVPVGDNDGSSRVKIELMEGEADQDGNDQFQEVQTGQSRVYGSATLALEPTISSVLDTSPAPPYHPMPLSVSLTPNLSLIISLTLQGTGFKAWLRNLEVAREAAQQRQFTNRKKKVEETTSHSRKMRGTQKNGRKNYEHGGEDDNDVLRRPINKEAPRTQPFQLKGIQDILGQLHD